MGGFLRLWHHLSIKDTLYATHGAYFPLKGYYKAMRQKSIQLGLSWLVFVGFMMLLHPTNLPVVVLIVPFVLLFICLYNSWMFMAAIWGLRKHGGIASKKAQRAGLFVCASFVLLAVLQSLGQLTVKDSLTVVGLVLLGYFYSARFRTDAKNH